MTRKTSPAAAAITDDSAELMRALQAAASTHIEGAEVRWQCDSHLGELLCNRDTLVGAVLGLIWLRLNKVNAATPIPFGPYLAIAGWIALLWGGQITDFYWHFVGLK